MLVALYLIDSDNIEVSNVSWTRENSNTANSPAKLLRVSPESNFPPEQNNLKQFILQWDASIPQDTKDKPSSLLKMDFDSIVSKSPKDVGRINIFQMDIPNAAPPIACKSYLILINYQMCIDEEIQLLEKAGYILKSLGPWVAQVNIVLPKQTL